MVGEWIPEVPGSLTGENSKELHLHGGKCLACGRVYFPMRRNCPNCRNRKPIETVVLANTGILQSFVVADAAPPGYGVPHAQGYIDLDDDGPRVFSLLVDYGDRSNLSIGQRMALTIVETGRDEHNRAFRLPSPISRGSWQIACRRV